MSAGTAWLGRIYTLPGIPEYRAGSFVILDEAPRPEVP